VAGWRGEFHGGLAWRVSWRVGVAGWRGGFKTEPATDLVLYVNDLLKYVYIEVKWLKPVCGECGGWRVHSQFLCIPGFYVVFFNPLGICN